MKISVQTSKNKEVIDITEQVQSVLEKEKASEGVCNIHVAHTTAAITTADLDPGTDEDISEAFEKIIPKLNWRHPHDPSHTPDHIASSLVGTSISLPFENKKLILGSWQRVILAEFSGPRERTVVITIT